MLDSRTGENIKEFIVQSISNMIKARASNIKSGWKIVLNIINAAATTVPNGSLDQAFTRCRLALDVIALILKKYFWIAVEHFGEVVRCIVSFGLLHSSEHSMKAALPLEVRIQKHFIILSKLMSSAFSQIEFAGIDVSRRFGSGSGK